MDKEGADLLPINTQIFEGEGFTWNGKVRECRRGPTLDDTRQIQFAIQFTANPLALKISERWLTLTTYPAILSNQQRLDEIYEMIRGWLKTDEQEGKIDLFS